MFYRNRKNNFTFKYIQGAELGKSVLSVKQIPKFLAAILFLMAACGKDEFIPEKTGEEYFPLHVGLSWTYQVAETVYSEVAPPEQKSYLLKVEVVDSILNGAGTYTHVIYRSTQTSPGSPWESLDTWSVRKSDSEVIVYEGNTPYKKLLFPIRDGLAWNGNQYNSLGEDRYSMQAGQREVNGITFGEALTVEEENNDDFIVFLDEREAVYAKNVGLVRQSIIQLNYCTAENCIGQQKVKSGRVYIQELVSYAKN